MFFGSMFHPLVGKVQCRSARVRAARSHTRDKIIFSGNKIVNLIFKKRFPFYAPWELGGREMRKALAFEVPRLATSLFWVSNLEPANFSVYIYVFFIYFYIQTGCNFRVFIKCRCMYFKWK